MSIANNGKPERRVTFQPQVNLAAIGELTDDEREAIRAKAREQIAKERKQQAEDDFLKVALREERERVDPNETKQPIFLDLANHCEYIMLDSTYYFHNHVYQVTPAVFAVLQEQIARGWAHEEATQVRDEKMRRRQSTLGVTFSNFSNDQRAQRDLSFSSGQIAGATPQALLRA